MAQKKRSKPIKIALTEEQIANIINEAAQSRRGVNVESLEDRIAPSRFGLPVFGGAEAGIEPELPGDGFEGGEGGEPGDLGGEGGVDGGIGGEGGVDGGVGGEIPFDPANPAPFDPANPGGFGGDAGGSIPFDPNNPAPFDPASGGTPPWMEAPGGEGGPEGPGAPGWFDDGTPGEPTNPQDPLDGLDTEPSLTQDWSQFPEGFPVEELPDDLKQVMQGHLEEMQRDLVEQLERGEELPSEGELAEHRNNILSNLLDEYNSGSWDSV